MIAIPHNLLWMLMAGCILHAVFSLYCLHWSDDPADQNPDSKFYHRVNFIYFIIAGVWSASYFEFLR